MHHNDEPISIDAHAQANGAMHDRSGKAISPQESPCISRSAVRLFARDMLTIPAPNANDAATVRTANVEKKS